MYVLTVSLYHKQNKVSIPLSFLERNFYILRPNIKNVRSKLTRSSDGRFLDRYRNNLRICFPESALSSVCGKSEKSATSECGFFIGSSCFIGTKYTFFLDRRVARLPRFADIASFEASAMIKDLSLRKCAFAAMQTGVSVIPFASFASVLPVQGAITSASSDTFGPRGSASAIVFIIFRSHTPSILSIHSRAVPNRVSVL